MAASIERLRSYLDSIGEGVQVEPLTADASTREYFRIPWNASTAVACIYPEPFSSDENTYLDTSSLFLSADLPVAEIYAVSEEHGILIQEDLGDRILRTELGNSDEGRRDLLRKEAISLIARIQLATPRAFSTGSIASTLRFDKEKLLWELDFFKQHYFETYLGKSLSSETSAALSQDFSILAGTLDGYAGVLCHRDFHAANLMLDANDKMRIIDHQDARIGSAAYDLVSFLLDRITEPPPPEWLAAQRKYFLTVRSTLGLPKIDEADFAYEFRLQTLQRCLKAVGTFSYQSAVRGKTYFVPFIKPMFRIVLRSAGNVEGFVTLKEILSKELEREN